MGTRFHSFLLGTLDEITNVPYHLPDETEIENCTIEFKIPDDPKWATIILGAISELAREGIWEADTGGITVAQAIVTALEIRESVEFTGCDEVDMQIKVGSYTGDDSNPQAITGVGFLPVLVVVWMRHDNDANRGVAFRATGDTAAMSFNPGDMRYKDDISSLDADGFSVRNEGGSSEFKGNEASRVYTYVAFSA